MLNSTTDPQCGRTDNTMALRLILLHAFPLDDRMWSGQLGISSSGMDTPILYGLGDKLESWANGVLKSTHDDDPLVVIGSSMGGSCALEMARQAPDRIAALVLVGTKAGHRPEPNLRDGIIDSLRNGGVHSLWSWMISELIGFQAERHVIDRIKEIMLDQHNEDLIRAVRVFHGRSDLSDVVKFWEKPLLVICGDCDRTVPEWKASTLANRASHGQMHVMRGCGHYMNMERPSEFNRVVGEFVHSVERDIG
jgi:pimeloyl-ACP methyl ester carboxylesterase